MPRTSTRMGQGLRSRAAAKEERLAVLYLRSTSSQATVPVASFTLKPHK